MVAKMKSNLIGKILFAEVAAIAAADSLLQHYIP